MSTTTVHLLCTIAWSMSVEWLWIKAAKTCLVALLPLLCLLFLERADADQVSPGYRSERFVTHFAWCPAESQCGTLCPSGVTGPVGEKCTTLLLGFSYPCSVGLQLSVPAWWIQRVCLISAGIPTGNIWAIWSLCLEASTVKCTCLSRTSSSVTEHSACFYTEAQPYTVWDASMMSVYFSIQVLRCWEHWNNSYLRIYLTFMFLNYSHFGTLS